MGQIADLILVARGTCLQLASTTQFRPPLVWMHNVDDMECVYTNASGFGHMNCLCTAVDGDVQMLHRWCSDWIQLGFGEKDTY